MHDALWVYDRPGLRNISPHRVAVLSREQRQVSRYIVLFVVPSNWGKGVGLVIGLINITYNWDTVPPC